MLVGSAAAPAAAQVAPSTDSGSSSGTFIPYYDVSLQASPVYGQVLRPGFLLSPILSTNVLEATIKLGSSGESTGSASIVDPGPLGGFPSLIPLAVGSELPAIPWPGWPLTASSSYPVQPEQSVGIGGVPAGFPGGNCQPASDAAHAGLLFAGAVAAQDNACGSAYMGAASSAGALVSVGSATATATATADSTGSVKGIATSTLTDLEIGGFLHIGSLISTTTVTTSASGATSESSVALGDVTVLGGWEAKIDGSGIHIIGLPGGVPSIGLNLQQADDRLDSALKSSGLSVRLLSGSRTSAPPDSTTAAQSSASGLQISYPVNLPVTFPNIPSVPLAVPLGSGVPDDVTLNLGESQGSTVAGGTTFGGSVGGAGGNTSIGNTSVGGLTPAGGPPSSDLPVQATSSTGSPSAAPASLPAPTASPTQPALGTGSGTPAQPSGFSPVVPAFAARSSITAAFGWVMALGILAAVMMVLEMRQRSHGLLRLLSGSWREVRR